MNCCNRIPQIKATEKYLILYAYAGRISNDEADWIAEYAKKKNLKVYAIGGIQKCADRFVDCSPFEVLAYFRNAEEVITDGRADKSIAYTPENGSRRDTGVVNEYLSKN